MVGDTEAWWSTEEVAGPHRLWRHVRSRSALVVLASSPDASACLRSVHDNDALVLASGSSEVLVRIFLIFKDYASASIAKTSKVNLEVVLSSLLAVEGPLSLLASGLDQELLDRVRSHTVLAALVALAVSEHLNYVKDIDLTFDAVVVSVSVGLLHDLASSCDFGNEFLVDVSFAKSVAHLDPCHGVRLAVSLAEYLAVVAADLSAEHVTSLLERAAEGEVLFVAAALVLLCSTGELGVERV